MILGVTGYLCSGKDTVADLLKKKGFEHISLSNFLRESLEKQNKEVTRANLQKLGNDLRTLIGSEILAEKALMQVIDGTDYTITSIGTVGELKTLNKRPDCKVIFVDAPLEERWNRMKKRNRNENDPQTFAEFKKHESLESKGGGAAYREFDLCKKEADIVLMNDGTLEDLCNKVDKVVANVRTQVNTRPSWDEYFMEVARAISKRATCDRGKTGCVIVKDKQILASGYVGSPMGQPKCDEAGHLIEYTVHSDGVKRPHCVRTVHSEQNAIIQAAKNGTAINGATIYTMMEPCSVCAMMIINSGIKRVICEKRYHAAQRSREMFKKANVTLEAFSDEVRKYANQ